MTRTAPDHLSRCLNRDGRNGGRSRRSPNSIWIPDTAHFTAGGVAATAAEDLISRKWLAHIVWGEETCTQVCPCSPTPLNSRVAVLAPLDRPDAVRGVGQRTADDVPISPA